MINNVCQETKVSPAFYNLGKHNQVECEVLNISFRAPLLSSAVWLAGDDVFDQ